MCILSWFIPIWIWSLKYPEIAWLVDILMGNGLPQLVRGYIGRKILEEVPLWKQTTKWLIGSKEYIFVWFMRFYLSIWSRTTHFYQFILSWHVTLEVSRTAGFTFRKIEEIRFLFFSTQYHTYHSLIFGIFETVDCKNLPVSTSGL